MFSLQFTAAYKLYPGSGIVEVNWQLIFSNVGQHIDKGEIEWHYPNQAETCIILQLSSLGLKPGFSTTFGPEQKTI